MGFRLGVALAVVGVALFAVQPALAISRAKANAAALAALRPQAAGRGVVVVGMPNAFAAGTAVSAAGPGKGERWKASAGKLGATVARTKLKGRGWLFWEDLHAGANFPHASKLVLVDDRTGTVAWTRDLQWFPLVNDKPAAFYNGWADKKYRVYGRGGKDAARMLSDAFGRRAALDSPRYPDDCLVTLYDKNDMREFANFRGDSDAMMQLASELGFRGRVATTTINDFVDAVKAQVAAGCKDVVVYVAGHGTPAEGPGATNEPTVVLNYHFVPLDNGTQSVITDEVVTLADLQALGRIYDGKAQFKFLINSCFSGRFADGLAEQRGVRFVATASAADELSVQAAVGDTQDDHPYESGTYAAGILAAMRDVVDGRQPGVSGTLLAQARANFATALSLATESAAYEGSGQDHAARDGLTHPVHRDGTVPYGIGTLARDCLPYAPNDSKCETLKATVTFSIPFSGWKVILPNNYTVATGEAFANGVGVGQCNFATTTTRYDTAVCGTSSTMRADTTVTFSIGTGKVNPDGTTVFAPLPDGAGATLVLTSYPGSGSTFKISGP